MFPRFLARAAVLSVVGLSAVGTALAHIDPDPTEAQAGSTLSVGFTVEHGCDGSPTMQLDMRLPEGVTNASPDPLDGWDGSMDDNVITFVGGPLADDVEQTFAVTMTLPPTPDTTIYFPFVQRCEVGEIRWIGIPTDPGDELDEPAPALALTGPTVTTTAPATTPSATTPSATTPPATTPSATTPAAVEPTTPATTEAAPVTSLPAVEATVSTTNSGENGSSNTGTVIFIASIAAVLVVGALAYVRSRSARNVS